MLLVLKNENLSSRDKHLQLFWFSESKAIVDAANRLERK